MDSRDSSSTSMAVSSKENLDEDGALSVISCLAKEAASLFQLRKYAECVTVLRQLLQKKEDDPKVLHNIAIGEYFRDGCSDPRKLLEALNNVKRRSEELACASVDHVEVVRNLENKVVSGSKGTNAPTQLLSTAKSASIDYADEFDTCMASLNIAVIWYQLHEYTKALSLLEPLFQNIEPIDETVALHICLLMLDIALATHDASKFADVIIYLAKAFNVGVAQGDNTSAGQQQISTLAGKSYSVLATSDTSIADLAASANVSETTLSRTLSEETIDYETLLSTLNIGGENLPRAGGGLTSSNDLSRTPARSITIDLKLKLQLYKVQLLLLTRNLKLAKREAKEAMNIARGRDSSMALLLKSQLEYARGNYRKAIKLLIASSNRTEPGILSILNNNLGCIYYQLGKYHTSNVFFSRALTNISSLRKDKPKNLSTFSQDKSLLVIYNCGVQYLACGKPVSAARCFRKVGQVFYDQPLFWLRYAECCLVAVGKGLIKSSRGSSNASEARFHVIGKGKWRQLVMDDGISRNGQSSAAERDDGVLSNDGAPELSMRLARQCLLNVVHILNPSWGLAYGSHFSSPEDNSPSDAKVSNITNGEAKDQKGGTGWAEVFESAIVEHEAACKKRNLMTKQAALANLAYVELELENPLRSLSAAASLLKLPDCSRIYTFLSHIYAAEALCLLNQPKEASKHLLTYVTGGTKVEFPYGEEDLDQWREKPADSEESNGSAVVDKIKTPSKAFLKPEEACGTLYVNLATSAALEGELEQAVQFITRALSIIPDNTEAILTAVYVDLRLGKTQEALTRLRRCSRASFLPHQI